MTAAPAAPSFWRIVRKGLLWALAGAVLLPAVLAVVVLTLFSLNAVCGTPGDSGGCEMGLAAIVMLSPLPGLVIGFIAGLVRGSTRPA
ncbi:MAG: hypothetical protein Q8M26_01905 [Pseudolabrys sp.]|nr:hypothetical protein [Pseudolabrys sp.]